MTIEGLQGIKIGSDFKFFQEGDNFMVRKGETTMPNTTFNKYDKQAAQRIMQMYSNVYQEDIRQDYASVTDWDGDGMPDNAPVKPISFKKGART